MRTKSNSISFKNIFFIVLLISSLLVFSYSAFAYDCVDPTSELITEDSIFCEGAYYLPDGISVDDGITLECDNTEIVGDGSGQGLILDNKVNVAVNGCTFSYFFEGIFVVDSEDINLDHNVAQNNTKGIAVYSSKNVVLTKNTMQDN